MSIFKITEKNFHRHFPISRTDIGRWAVSVDHTIIAVCDTKSKAKALTSNSSKF